MDKTLKKKYTIITIIVLALILITIGVSYALWTITKEQENENILSTTCLNVTMEEEKDDFLSFYKCFL